MAEDLLVVAGSSSEGEASAGWPRSRRRGQVKRKRRRRCLQAASEVIDLTGDDLVGKTAAHPDFGVIDLTQPEETMGSPLHSGGCVFVDLTCSTPTSIQPVYSPKILNTLDPEKTLDLSLGLWDRKQPSPKEDSIQQAYFQGSSGGDSENSSHTTYNSDLGSLGSPQLGSDVFSFSSSSDSEHETFQEPVEDDHDSCPPDGDLNLPLSDQRHSPSSPSSCCPRNVTLFLTKTDQCALETKNSIPIAVKPEAQEPTQQIDIKVWMKTLQCFPGVPVHHPFLQNVVREKDARQNEQQKARPIPSRRLSMVSSTIEENFFRGTLDFLMDYVSSQYYPPKNIISCVVEKILLSREVQQDIQKDAYMLLMKIQALHPARADTVIWDWDLLREVMRKQENVPGRLLFLNYVIQTLEDDFQMMARSGMLPKSIAKKVLSCDQCFSNIKELNEWLVASVMGTRFSHHRNLQEACPLSESSKDRNSISIPELHLAQTPQQEESSLHFQTEREVDLLQRMLSIAIEVDKSPVCSAIKIADMMFSSVLNMPKRCQRFLPAVSWNGGFGHDSSPSLMCGVASCAVKEEDFVLFEALEGSKGWICTQAQAQQCEYTDDCLKNSYREAFLSSMQCHLLRCKVLELIFHHNCNKPINLPLSVAKILAFLTHFSPLMKYQDNEAAWQRWDEMLHQLNSLVLSYHRIVLGHLRSPVCERINLIIKAAKPKLQSHDSITFSDADDSINSFQNKLVLTLGQPLPSPIKEKIDLLQILFHTTTDIYRTFGHFARPLPGGST